MKIRKATVDDAASIAILGADIQQMHHEQRPDWFKPANDKTTVEMYREMLTNAAFTVYIAEEGKEPLGFVAAVVHQRPHTPLGWAQTVLEVDQIGVAPSARRRGVGHALFTVVRELADEVSADRIGLTTWVFNFDAHRFFEAEGLETEMLRMSMPRSSH
jgi:PhnO protein